MIWGITNDKGCDGDGIVVPGMIIGMTRGICTVLLVVCCASGFISGTISGIYKCSHPVIRAIGVSHAACKDEFRQNILSHSWSVFLCL